MPAAMKSSATAGSMTRRCLHWMPRPRKNLIRRTLDAIASVTGKRPVGWVSPGHRINEYTFGHFVDEGIFWTGDLPGPDIPQHRVVNGKPIVIMPRFDYANDLSLLFTHKNPARVYFDSFKAAFDCLYAEGQAGAPKLIDCLVHAHIGGRPEHHRRFRRMYPLRQGFSRCLVRDQRGNRQILSRSLWQPKRKRGIACR